MLNLIETWDKVFPRDESVNHKKVTFKNHFGIELAADLFWPKASGTFPSIAISGPFGAVKEQSSGLYAQEMAKRGFLALAFDPSFTGESGGEPRYMNSPDINVEDFQSAVDFLSNLDIADPDKISIIGICGWGGMALQTACIDTRIKATVAITMYDMSRVTGNGYFDSADNEEARYQQRLALSKQRTIDFKNGTYQLGGGVVDDPSGMPDFVKQYFDYYKTPRGYHPRSLNSNGGWNVTAGTSLLNTRLLTYASEIRNAVLIVHGEKAHSLYFGQDAFKLLKGENKEFLLVKDATHCDLYDGGENHDKIPFGDIEAFIRKHC
ncbi:MAG: alpha/beta hydrolase [Bacilli bacterium]|nr:alpha/beta hydrolase [Bacilli bacterium]